MSEEPDVINWLAGRLDRLEESAENQQKRPWYRRASDVFSLLAVLVAIVSVGFSLWSQSEQSTGDDRRHLSGIFNEIGSVNAEMAKLAALALPDDQKDLAGYALQNQLWTLLKDADRLASKFSDDLSALEKAVLGASFSQIPDIERAEHYYSALLKPDVEPFQRAVGFRSLANLVFLKGQDHFDEVDQNYKKAIEILAGLSTLHAGRERTNVYIMQARLNIARHRTDLAAESLVRAWQELRTLPCMELLGQIAGMIRQYSAVIGLEEPIHEAEECVFIGGPHTSIQLDRFKGKFRTGDGTMLEIATGDTGLEVRLAKQRHQLVILREGVFELMGGNGYFLVFPPGKTGPPDTVSLYQPNGIYLAQRVE